MARLWMIHLIILEDRLSHTFMMFHNHDPWRWWFFYLRRWIYYPLVI
jgi:hypothetical protein